MKIRYCISSFIQLQTTWLNIEVRLLFLRKAFDVLNDNPNLTILGNDMARRLPIFSMIFYHQDSGKLVHHNFVSVLLNDLYGIQARGGCACAGPYAQVSLNWFISDTRFFPFYMINSLRFETCFLLLPLIPLLMYPIVGT